MSALVEDSANVDIRRLRAVLDAASDGYLCADASAVVVDCNRAAEELFGHSRAELIGAVLPELMAPAELHEEWHAIYQQLLVGGGVARAPGACARASRRHGGGSLNFDLDDRFSRAVQ